MNQCHTMLAPVPRESWYHSYLVSDTAPGRKSADHTIKLADQLRIRLARYRAAHGGADPKWIEVNPIAFPAVLSQLNLSPATTDFGVPMLDGVALRRASESNAELFVSVDR